MPSQYHKVHIHKDSYEIILNFKDAMMLAV